MKLRKKFEAREICRRWHRRQIKFDVRRSVDHNAEKHGGKILELVDVCQTCGEVWIRKVK